MLTPTQTNYRNRYGSEGNASAVLISFAAHEEHLKSDLDRLAHLDCANRSQYVKRLIRREKQRLQEQQSTSWSDLLGGK